MNRAERRRQVKEEKGSLNSRQKNFLLKFDARTRQHIDDAINEVADMKFKDKVQELVGYIDVCITAAMHEKTELNYEQILEIQEYSMILLNENTEKVNKLKNEFREDWTMQINKKEKLVREKCTELLEKGVKQKEAIEILQQEFSMLSRSMLVNAYKKVKEEMKAANELKNISDEEKENLEKAVEHIWGEEKKEEVEATLVIDGEERKITGRFVEGRINTEKVEDEMELAKLSINKKLDALKIIKEENEKSIKNFEKKIGDLRQEQDVVSAKEEKIRQALELLSEV